MTKDESAAAVVAKLEQLLAPVDAGMVAALLSECWAWSTSAPEGQVLGGRPAV
jgi:hypothetical protein